MKLISSILAVTLIGAGSLFAQTQQASVKSSVAPDYPRDARELNLQGVVVVEALVDESGQIFATDVVDSPANQLSKAAIEAVQKWAFNPAIEEGQPVMQVVRIPIVFHLNDPLRDTVKDAANSAVATR
jgi:TonB family protein